MNKKMVEMITLQTIMINNAQNIFFFKDKGKEMRLQMHDLIEKKKKQINIINWYTMKNELTLIYNLSAARWPHGCRRKYSEVAVPMLVGSNPTEGGGFFQRKEPPPGHGCVCMSPRG
jgi:hypothetical protein